ncbi:MAG: sigma 54-interacting transcriptional regulator [Cetobacterium somerae]|jgi:two-component system NtrC family response regulator|uniref:Sigma-54 interaction domain protein n=2 Tax=Cetobacterium TaxID=180162 RepID=U7VDC5_9FUSO|nr:MULTISPECIES: sigma-54 dependent transcriptional regulator [Cetobacterium]ERT69687.1 Sigma-54 interaction domain protein [Cetobacterium somerae ATCC BAA-474]MBC2853399.1 sigma-54-dependent Fis family transcriptional regulator [Cetobacterium sp. 2G large]MCQ9625801.1 sigma-54-dependent Fis family transcriptional regulator [Cetobacterium somerae]WVJ01564.1 sigma-54 dependent transcriptional regulator [Cetobacterium somerae]
MKKSILVVSERKETLKQVRKALSEVYEIITFNNLLDALDMLRESDFDVVLLDEYLTWFNFSEAKRKLNGIGKDFVVIGLLDEENEALIQEMKEADIYNYLLKPVDVKEMNRIMIPALRSLEIVKEKRKLEEKLSDTEDENEIIGQSARIKEVKNLIDKVAESDLTVLITGENGVGKELIAKEIFKKSDRRKENYITISCASLPEDLIERELFGYERGAFLGATTSKKGILEEADGGTVFLDEISAMDLKAQSKVLRVIEYGEFRRVGGNKSRRVDVRFIVSTNKDLKEETEKGKFRKDLYHRLTAFPIEVAPLRDRKDDIPMLANYFLNKIVKDLRREIPVISGDAMKYLMEYSYPGNIRELKNMIERMVILCNDRNIDVEDLPLEIKMKSDTVENKTVIGVGPLKNILEQEIYALDEVEKVVIAMALQKTRWNKQETSKLLGIGRTTLYEKIRKYGLDTK